MKSLLFGAALVALATGGAGSAFAQTGSDVSQERLASSCTETEIAQVQDSISNLPDEQRLEAQRLIQQAQDHQSDNELQLCAQLLAQAEEMASGMGTEETGAAAPTVGTPATAGVATEVEPGETAQSDLDVPSQYQCIETTIAQYRDSIDQMENEEARAEAERLLQQAQDQQSDQENARCQQTLLQVQEILETAETR